MTATPPQHPKLFAAALLCFAASVAALPAWDALAHPARSFVAVLSAVAAIVGIRATHGVARWGLFIGGVLFISAYTAYAGGVQLLERSRQTDRLPECKPGEMPGGDKPCLAKGESRDEHRQWSPDGDLEDGFRQIILRYPADQRRLILGPMLAVFLAGAAGVMLAKSMGHSADEP